MPRGTKRTVEDVMEQFRPYVGKKGTPVVRINRLDEVACRWFVDYIDEQGYAILSHPNPERAPVVAHVFNLTIAPVASRGASGPIRANVTLTHAEREERLAKAEAARKQAAELAIAARQPKR